MSDCLFCRIARGESATELLYDDGLVVAFRDIRPRYRVHLLLVPKEHIPSSADLTSEHSAVAGALFRVGAVLAQREGIARSGYRLTTNVGADSGQVIPHLHVHLLGGEPLRAL